MLDLRSEDVRLMLQEEDDRVATHRHYRFLMGFALVGFLLSLPLVGWFMAVGGDRTDYYLCFLPVAVAEMVGEGLYRLFPSQPVLPADMRVGG